jgi:hypothetical protein
MGAARYRSAWTDPEFVRLSSYASWWDRNANGPAVRSPVPREEDVWSGPLPHCALRKAGGAR